MLTLNRFLGWLFAARNPVVIGIREFIRRHDILLFSARLLIRGIRRLPGLSQKREVFRPDERQQAIMSARSVGGAISVSELENIWSVAAGSPKILCIAQGPELLQLRLIFAGPRFRPVRYTMSASGLDGQGMDGYDVVIVSELACLEQQIVELQNRCRPEQFLRVGQNSKRSEFVDFYSASLETIQSRVGCGGTLQEKFARGDAIHVVFLNDIGFQYGAGIALKRQVASFLLLGWQVSIVAWAPGNDLNPPAVTGIKQFEGWRGVQSATPAKEGDTSLQTEADLCAKIETLNPDLVITGNLHGAGWPLQVLPKLQSLGVAVVAFMHDTYFVTGRCAQPAGCILYRTGCDARCPTPWEYPRLDPDKIAPAWQERASIFSGDRRIPLIGNSRWTRGIAVQRFGESATTGVVSLSLDHELFAPIPKAVARRILRIPDNKIVVVMGAVDVTNQWKGGPLFHGLHKALSTRDDLNLVLFGRLSDALKSRKSFGLVTDERIMPFILSAADIFVSTATAESFGQSVLEASACAIPVVAFDVGGVSDVVVHDQTGILVKELIVDSLLAAINHLVKDPEERQRMGRNGRLRVLDKFSLIHQAQAWVDCLKGIC